jgi:taurine dioxygenase
MAVNSESGRISRLRLAPIGVELTGPALTDVSATEVGELKKLLAEHGVLVLRGQHLDDAGFVAFLARFGDLMFTAGETPVPGARNLNLISNVGRSSPPRSVFHTDSSYLHRPPAYTALRAVKIPDRGGQTEFTNQYLAYETLPVDIRTVVRGRTITHVVTGLELTADDEREAEHPIVRRHPFSLRPALYLSTPQRCVAVSGMDAASGHDLIARLYAHSTRPANIHTHRWQSGDIVMWDNRCVLHRADHSDVVGDRVLHRGMVGGPA